MGGVLGLAASPVAAEVDLVSKVWNTGGLPYHVDLWRNDNPSCRGAGAQER